MKKLMMFLIAAVMCFSCCIPVCSAESLFDQIMSQPDVEEDKGTLLDFDDFLTDFTYFCKAWGATFDSSKKKTVSSDENGVTVILDSVMFVVKNGNDGKHPLKQVSVMYGSDESAQIEYNEFVKILAVVAALDYERPGTTAERSALLSKITNALNEEMTNAVQLAQMGISMPLYMSNMEHSYYFTYTEEKGYAFVAVILAAQEDTENAPELSAAPGVTAILFETPEPTPEPTPTPEPEPTPDPKGPFDYETEFSGIKRTGTYTGENANGIPEGQGTFTSTDDLPALVYEGSWAGGRPVGKGHLKDDGFTIRFQNESQGAFDRTGPYDGDVVDGIPNGQGNFSAVNDDGIRWTYKGAFADGTFNGYGEQSWDTDNNAPDKGTFVNGEFAPTVAEIVQGLMELLEYEVSEKSIDFINQHEDLFVSATEIDPELVLANWSINAYKQNPNNYGDKLVRLEDVPVMEAPDTGTDQVSIISFRDGSGILYMAIYMEEQVYHVGDMLDEVFVLPMCKVVQDGSEFFVCMMALPGSNLKTESVSVSTAEPTPVPFAVPDGADRSVKIIEENLTVETGKRLKLTAEVTALTEDAPEKSVLIWSSSDTSIARVDTNGNVTGVKPGPATIMVCLKDNPEIKAWIEINVVRPVTGIKLSDGKLTITKGSSATITATVSPKDATNQEVAWSSTVPSVATVSTSGKVIALSGGDCEIVATTSDGGKTASVKVHVPAFSTSNNEYWVNSKNGLKIKVEWASNESVYLQNNGSNYFSANWVEDEDAFQVVPLKAGKGTVVLYTEGNKDRQTITINIEHNAVYDNVFYPAIDYNSAMRYPDNWKGNTISFSGRVLQVMQDGDTTTYRISSKGRYDNVVYVTIKNSDILTPVIEEDNVTVYGSLNGNKTYTSTFGQSITIPWVKAERINVK